MLAPILAVAFSGGLAGLPWAKRVVAAARRPVQIRRGFIACFSLIECASATRLIVAPRAGVGEMGARDRQSALSHISESECGALTIRRPTVMMRRRNPHA